MLVPEAGLAPQHLVLQWCKYGDRSYTRGRSLETCPELQGFGSAELAGTDHRLLVTTPKIRLKSRRMVPSNQVLLDVHRLRNKNGRYSINEKLRNASANLAISPTLRN